MAEPAETILDAQQRRHLWTLAAVPLVLAVLALVGQVAFAALANSAPLLLIAIAPSDAFLVLTVGSVPTWAFFAVGFAVSTGPKGSSVPI